MSAIARVASRSASFSQSVTETNQIQSVEVPSSTPADKPTQVPAPDDSYRPVEMPAETKKATSKPTAKKSRSEFKLEARGKAPVPVAQAGEACRAPDPNPCQDALQRIEAGIDGLGKKLDALLRRGLPEVCHGAEQLGCHIKDVRERLCADLQGRGKPGPISADPPNGKPGPVSADPPHGKPGPVSADPPHGKAGPVSADPPHGKPGPVSADPLCPGGPNGPGDVSTQLQQLVQMLGQLLQVLQGMLGGAGCGSSEQNEVFRHLAKGCGTPVPAGSVANQSIEAITGSFSSATHSAFSSSNSISVVQY